MDRVGLSAEKFEQLFGSPPDTAGTDPELMAILRHVIFGEVFHIGALDDRTRELITIVLLVTNQTLPQLRSHTAAALNVVLLRWRSARRCISVRRSWAFPRRSTESP